MKRDLSPDEARDQHIATLTEKHFQIKRAALANGDVATTSDVTQALSIAISDELWDGLVQLSVIDPAAAGGALQKMVEHQLRLEAEVAAIVEVEQLEKARRRGEA